MKKLRMLILGALVLNLIALSAGELAQQAQQDTLGHLSERRLASYRSAEELRQSSDDLTRLARTYVATGDARYLAMFDSVQAIRDGQQGRPINYHNIYWDLISSPEERPRPDGAPMSLRHQMQVLGFTEHEFALLDKAKVSSDRLVNMELEAFAALKRGAGRQAVSILFSDEYHTEKARIMGMINEFIAAMEARTGNEVSQARAELEQLQLLNKILLAAMAAFLLLLIFASRHSAATTNHRELKANAVN